MTSVLPHLIALAATIADDWGVFVFIAALVLVAVFVGRWVREWEDAHRTGAKAADWVDIRNASEPATPLTLLAQQNTQGGVS